MLDMLQDHDPHEDAAAMQARETSQAVRRMALTLLLSSLLLLALNSGQLVTWVNGFEVGPVQDRIVTFSTSWNEKMAEAGLTQPAEAAREDVNRARQVNWDEVKRWIENEQARSREGTRALRGVLVED
jgi:hypothetical protein